MKLKLSLDIPKLNNIQRLSNVLGKLKLNKENDKFWHDNFVFIEVEITDMENPLHQTFSANWLEWIKDMNHIHELSKIP